MRMKSKSHWTGKIRILLHRAPGRCQACFLRQTYDIPRRLSHDWLNKPFRVFSSQSRTCFLFAFWLIIFPQVSFIAHIYSNVLSSHFKLPFVHSANSTSSTCHFHVSASDSGNDGFYDACNCSIFRREAVARWKWSHCCESPHSSVNDEKFFTRNVDFFILAHERLQFHGKTSVTQKFFRAVAIFVWSMWHELFHVRVNVTNVHICG